MTENEEKVQILGELGYDVASDGKITSKDAPEPGAWMKESKPLTHKIDGDEYPLFVANRTAHIGSMLKNPSTGANLAMVTASLAWEKTIQPFFDQLDIELRDERIGREEESVRKTKNMMMQNANLFDALVQSGTVVVYDEHGEAGETIEKDRDSMLSLAPEIKAQIVDDWINSWHIARFFPSKTPDIEALLTGTESGIFFKARIGNPKSPIHILSMEFKTPSPDARKSYQDNVGVPTRKNQGDKLITEYHIDHKQKMNFAKRHLVKMSGVAITGKMGVMEIEESDLRPATDSPDDLELIKKGIAPHFWIQIADELADAFNFTGK